MKDDRFWMNIYIAMVVIAVIMALLFVSLKIYALIAYGDVPLKDCPTWVMWMLKD